MIESGNTSGKDLRENTDSIVARVGFLIDEKLNTFRQEILQTTGDQRKADSPHIMRGERMGEGGEPFTDSFPPSS